MQKLLRNLFRIITESYLLVMLLIDSRQLVVLVSYMFFLSKYWYLSASQMTWF